MPPTYDSMHYLVTGTDTGVGKTFLTTGLVRFARSLGIDCIGMKPICTGDNRDVLEIATASGGAEPAHLLNPIWYRAAASRCNFQYVPIVPGTDRFHPDAVNAKRTSKPDKAGCEEGFTHSGVGAGNQVVHRVISRRHTVGFKRVTCR